jgi:hypothetical protein
VVALYLAFQGTASELEALTKPMQDITTLSKTTKRVPYNELSKAFGLGNDSPACLHGKLRFLRFPLGLKAYNITAQRKVYDHFNEVTRQNREFENSFLMFEGYPLHAVKAVSDESTAVGDRQDNLLVYACATPSQIRQFTKSHAEPQW